MKYLALGERIVVRRDDPQTQKGNIILPERAQVKQVCGVVMNVGTDKDDKPITRVKKGDRVLFNDYGAFTPPDEKDIAVVRLDDVMCKIEKD